MHRRIFMCQHNGIKFEVKSPTLAKIREACERHGITEANGWTDVTFR